MISILVIVSSKQVPALIIFLFVKNLVVLIIGFVISFTESSWGAARPPCSFINRKCHWRATAGNPDSCCN